MSQEKFLVSKDGVSDFISYIRRFDVLNKLYDENKQAHFYKYQVGNETFVVYDSVDTKITSNCQNYNCGFNKLTGETWKFGSTLEEDPIMCKLGPEIMDLEISVNGCPKVGGHNCKFCYKNNSDAPATNMTFDTFKKIVDSFPKSLNQIAFGITGVQTNPDFPRMLNYCRNFLGIIPNYTLSGADLTDELIEITGETCGAVAVSCYEGNKELCYNTIERFHKLALKLHVNMHIVLSKGTLNHVYDVLSDMRRGLDGKLKIIYFKDHVINGLRNIVFLRIKPVGRASKLDTTIDIDTFEKLMSYCNEHQISYGFDSCTAPDVERVLRKWGKDDQCQYCEKCESAKFSIYISCEGKITPCSFCEKLFYNRAIDLVNNDYYIPELWNNNELLKYFRSLECKNQSCPIYQLDCV